MHRRDHLELVPAGPEGRVQGGHVPQKARMLGQRDRRVGGGHEPPADVVHEQGAAAPLRGGGHDRLVQAAGQAGQDAAFPQHQRGPAQAARSPHGPVPGQVEVLEHVGLPVDHDPLQRGSRLAGSLVKPGPFGRTREQGGQLIRHRPPPSRRAARPASGRRRRPCRTRYGRRAPSARAGDARRAARRSRSS